MSKFSEVAMGSENIYPLEEHSEPATEAEIYPLEGFRSDNPSVSVVIPCLNEERFIQGVLKRLAKQYDAESYEIIVVDGMSTDGTRAAVAEFVKSNPEISVRLVENVQRSIPAGLNRGIAEARGEVIVRMDAHSLPSENYVWRCLESLRTTNAVIVGMPWKISPGADTATARAVALAVAHPFGSGGVRYRAAGTSSTQFVDTVPFGVFRKNLWQELGGFNEALLANEDYEFNYRARSKGGKILLDGSGHCVYFARSTVRDVWKQYFRYGLWKAQMLRLHPRSIKFRQLIPPVFVITLILLAMLTFFSARARLALLFVAGTYALACVFFLAQILAEEKDVRAILLLPIVFPAIHLAWGTGFLIGGLR